MIDTTLVIPQYNTAHLTRDFVQSLLRNEPSPWPIIVIDDGSQQDLAEFEPSEFAECVTFLHQAHAGLTVAWNRALAAVTTPYAIVVNNDVVAHDPAVDRLVAPLRQQQALIVGPAWREERDWPPLTRQPIPRQPLLQGWCLAFAVETWKHLGGFDETLQLYFSDTDFQLQALAQQRSGSATLRVVDVPWQHLGHRTLHQMPEHRGQWRRDRQRFWEKWS